jgi:hypothetical protein
MMPRKEWNPYESLEGRAPYMIPSRHYVKPTIIRQQPRREERYNAEADMNQTTRTVVQGAVTIGALGLFGSILGGFNK